MKNDLLYLNHILESINAIIEFTTNQTHESFQKSRLLQSACLREIEVIGEAAKNISHSLKTTYPKIPWKLLSATRDKIIHHYFGIDTSIIWNIVKNDIPKLELQIREVIQNEIKILNSKKNLKAKKN